MDKEIKVTIEGGGLHYEDFTTKQKAGQIISFLGLETSTTVGTSSSGYESRVPVQLLSLKSSPRDVIEKSAAKTYAQKIAALAVHFMGEGKEQFHGVDVRFALKKLGDMPKNLSRDLKMAEELGYINSVDEQDDLYELTDRGEDAVKNAFPPIQGKKAKKGGRKQKGVRGIRDEVSQVDIVSTIDGFPGYHDLSTKGDQILWLLQYAIANGLKYLTSAEIDFLSSELQARIESKGVVALNKRNLKSGYVMKKDGGYVIQKKGEEYLKTATKE